MNLKKRNWVRAIRAGTAVALAMTLAAGCGDRGSNEVLATASGLRLTVDEAAELLASTDDLPNSPDVVTALGELWMDYTLLGTALLRDPEFERVDLGALLRQQLEQELVYRLRDDVIQVDTAVSEEDLRRAFEEDRPGEEVRASHILLSFPPGADEAAREEVQERAESLRERIASGASFEELAREHSDDPGSAAAGGDLGFFGRGMMVPAFEETAFALEPGEVSDVVESPFGLHIIRLEERRTPTFEETREEIREEIQMDRTLRAESLYVAQIEEPANIEVSEDAFATAREIAEQPEQRISGRAARRTLTTYEGGAFTAGDFRDFLAGQPQGIVEQIANASDQQLEGMLRNLTRVELLKEEADRRGIAVPEEEERRIRSELVANYREAAELLGLAEIEVREGESEADAVERSVRSLLEDILEGRRNVIPMAELGIPLRRQFGAELRTGAIPNVVERVVELRGNGSAPVDPTIPPQELPPPADSPAPDAEPAAPVPDTGSGRPGGG